MMLTSPYTSKPSHTSKPPVMVIVGVKMCNKSEKSGAKCCRDEVPPAPRRCEGDTSYVNAKWR